MLANGFANLAALQELRQLWLDDSVPDAATAFLTRAPVSTGTQLPGRACITGLPARSVSMGRTELRRRGGKHPAPELVVA